MSLSPGTRIGPYEITTPLGAGGMGEVYRARDTKLAREVAIKVLPPFFSLEPERLARFKREALALASLNHPHVATIYGLEDAGGEPALAMELVEGPSLTERIAAGRLEIDEALRLARQIAEGLDAAHRRGIVHRDLKPQNIKLTADGSVKLLDFGLAKVGERQAGRAALGSGVSDSPTISAPGVTSVGVLLGTAAFMAPEQARGQAVDHRADLWAFGCVLFEMLTGRRVFAGSCTTDVLSAILQSEPDWPALPSGTPAAARRLLRRCLQKRLDSRLDSARDAILEIDDALDPTAREDAKPVTAPRRWTSVLPAAAAALCLVALAIVLTRERPPAAPVLTKLVIPLPQPLVETGRPTLAISPDGSRLAFVAQHGESTAAYLRPVDGFGASLIPGTEGTSSISFSPDGEWMVFHAARRLRKVSVRGGPPVTLAAMADFMGATWSPQGSIIASSARSELQSIPADGGAAKSLLSETERADAQVARVLPHVLPGGAAVLLTLAKAHEVQGSIAVRVLASGEERILVPDATHPTYVDGWLVFARSGTLFAVRFDVEKLAVAGVPVPVLDGVSFSRSFGTTQYAVSATGELAYVTGSAAAARQLAVVDRKGILSALADARRAYFMPRIAPAGDRLALTILEDGAYGIWTTESLSGRPSQVAENSFAPVWSPDGQSIALTTSRDGGMTVAVLRLDGNAAPRTIVVDSAPKVPTAWTADGASILFTRVDPGGSSGEDIYIVNADGSGIRPLVTSPANESGAVVSRDGKWVAFSTFKGAMPAVVVARLSDPSRQSVVEWQTAAMPVWSASGNELFFLAGPQRSLLMSVAVTDDKGTPRLGTPNRVIEQKMGAGIGFQLSRYDVLPDGRFVFATAEEAAPPTEIRMVLGWTAQLRKLVTR